MPTHLPKDQFLIGAAIGSGSTALAAERGGADMLLAINAGRLRNMGAPSIACMMPVFNAEALTEPFAVQELLPQCRIPILLGVDVWGEEFDPDKRAREIANAGFAGAVNFPSCMHYPHALQQILSRAGRGIEREVDQLRAVQDQGLTSMFYCATRTQARLAADAGIDMVCLNLGWNVGGAMGHRQRASIEEVATAVRDIGRLIKRINPDVRFLLEGGPIATAEDLGQLLRLAPIDGYVGGSTFERMPLETSVSTQIDRFRHAGRQMEKLNSESVNLVSWGRRFGFVGRSKVQLDFLRRLKRLSLVKTPVLLSVPSGMNPSPCLNALISTKSTTPNTFQIDLSGEDFPARARAMLFGHPDTPRRRPTLGDGEIDLLVIRAPEKIPQGMQRRLARALTEGMFRAAGSRRPMPVMPRIVFLSQARPFQAKPEGGYDLDPDLAAALAGCEIALPALADRTEDLLDLIAEASKQRLGVDLTRGSFSAEALKLLHAHLWPDNEAEINAVLGGLPSVSTDTPINSQDLLPLLGGTDREVQETRSERDRIVDALWRHGFSKGRTAAALGMSRKTLYNKIKKYNLTP